MAHLGANGLFCVVTLSATLAACAADGGGGSGNGGNATVASPIGGTGGAGAGMPHVGTGGASSTTGGFGMQPGTMTPGGGGVAGTTGMVPPGTGGAPGVTPPAGSGGMGAPPAGTGGGSAMPPVLVGPDQMLPPVTDYTAPGPFDPTMEIDNTGPDGMYTMYRPTNLDQNGFKFIPTTWGNGITTTPQTYPVLLNTIASHGFVIIASNSTSVTSDLMIAGLDWLIAQNDSGDLAGKLDVDRAACIGYSLGGQASVGCGATHPKAIVTVAMHPAGGFPAGMKGPLLLFSGLMDDVCVRDSFVQPIYDQSPVATFFGTLTDGTHFEPPLTGGRELAPMVAWLRLWVFGDEGAKPFFYGTDCTLCKGDWTMPESKMLP
jgi:hypothetical protein